MRFSTQTAPNPACSPKSPPVAFARSDSVKIATTLDF
jgi:hypothetical protein